MDEEEQDRHLRPPVVQGLEEPAHAQLGDDLDDALVGEVHMGDVVEGHEHSREELEEEEEQGDPAGVVPDVVAVLRDELAPGDSLDPLKVVSLLQPVSKPWAVQP